MTLTKIAIAIMILGVVGLVGYGIYDSRQPGKLDGFAQCLKDSGAIFYGAFWCPNCQNQKKMLGQSEKFLPYVECSLPNGQGQNQNCQNKNIEAYPTWEFKDGSRLVGTTDLKTLAEKTACSLPQP